MDHRKWDQEHIQALQTAISILDIQHFPLGVLQVIELYIPSVAVIRKKVSLESNIIHYYDTLKIARDGVLTVEAWDPKYNRKGGVLRINCNTLIVESDGKIDVSGKGYKGGKRDSQGYSITFEDGILPQRSIKRNKGGGGAGAGGGYATQAMDRRLWGHDSNSQGGCTYGNKKVIIPLSSNKNKNKNKNKNAKMKKPKLKNGNSNNSSININSNQKKKKSRSPNNIKYNLYLGSGGGGDRTSCGSNGGGAIAIECRDNLILHERSMIAANGATNQIDWHGAGFGSGGSIYIKSPNIDIEQIVRINQSIFEPRISAVGGHNAARYTYLINGPNAPGGMGRIRIDCTKRCYNRLSQQKANLDTTVQPKVGYLHFCGD